MKRKNICGVMVGISFLAVHGTNEETVPAKASPIRVETSKNQKLSEVSFTRSESFDAEKKRKDVFSLLKKGTDFLEKHTLLELLWKINFTTEFDYGDLSLFVDDFKGTTYANRKTSSIWQNFIEEQDAFGTFFVKKMIDRAQHGGGWVSYEWQGSTKVSFVKKIESNGKKYVLGCGFYPHSKAEAVVALVRGAVATFYNYVDQDLPVEEAFSAFSFPFGKFVIGDLYIFVLDKDLNVLANGRDPGEVGVSYWDTKNEKGDYLLRKIPDLFVGEASSQGQWIDYDFYNTQMRTYVERVYDKQGNVYFIASGYYPQATRDAVESLVKRGKAALKERGLTDVAVTINDWANREFVFGRMALFIYDSEGNVIANGARPTIVGKNLLNERDESGYLYIQDIINRVKKETSAWVSFRQRKTVCTAYCESFVSDGKQYVIGSSYYPISKETSMMFLVKSAKGLLESSTEAKAFRAFAEAYGNYILGDLSVFVFGLDGTCYADGSEITNVWRNMLNEKDDEGRPYVKIMINAAKTGPAKVIIRKNGARMVTYVESVKKGNKTYIVGSGYYI